MRRVLVTGANKGIGLAIVEGILQEHDDTFVFLGSRSLERGRSALERLEQKHPAWADRVELVELDVSSDTSVGKAASVIAGRTSAAQAWLHAVVNNAGIGGAMELNEVLQVNAFGIQRVCRACLPLLEPTQGRIVNVTSAAGPNFVAECSPERRAFFLNADLDWPRLEAFMSECTAMAGRADEFKRRGLGHGAAYGLSKACANTYTLILARENPNLRINACTPGFIETDMTRSYAASQGKSPTEMGMKSPAEGAHSALFLLFGEGVGSGRYYGSDGLRSPLDRYRAPGTPAYNGD